MFRRLAETLGVDAVILNAEPDGNFPSHDPNPLKAESREQAAKAVRESEPHSESSWTVTETASCSLTKRARASRTTFFPASWRRSSWRARAGAAIVYDLISSRVLPERIRELGGEPVVSRVGYTFLYDRMVAAHAAFGAETSGHVYFKVSDTYYTESAAYALVVLMGLLASRGRPLSEMVAPAARPVRPVPRDQRRGKGQAEGHAGDRETLRKGTNRQAGRRVSGVRGLLVQRPAQQHGAPPAAAAGSEAAGRLRRRRQRRSRGFSPPDRCTVLPHGRPSTSRFAHPR